MCGGDERKNKRANRTDASTKAVHVVHEVEGIDDGEQPENGDGIAKNFAVHEQGDALARRRHGDGDEYLPDEFRQGFEFVFVVQPAENRDGHGAQREHGKFNRAPVHAMNNCGRGRNLYDSQLEQNRPGSKRQQNSCQHGKTACERNWRAVDFAMARIVNEVRAQTPFAPER